MPTWWAGTWRERYYFDAGLEEGKIVGRLESISTRQKAWMDIVTTVGEDLNKCSEEREQQKKDERNRIREEASSHASFRVD